LAIATYRSVQSDTAIQNIWEQDCALCLSVVNWICSSDGNASSWYLVPGVEEGDANIYTLKIIVRI
jgi:hypothetical protein